jgi:tetratricopeptide (TPR) repeat protein
LLARARLLQATDLPDGPARAERLEEAVRLNDRAEACSERAARSQGLWRQRAELARLTGDAAAARHDQRAAALPAETARDLYWLASEHLTHGRWGEALPLLRQATQREPQNFWAWFVLGNCHDRMGQDRQAEACYDTCAAIWPTFPWVYFNRGLARLRQSDHAGACADFDEVLRLRPGLAEAHINRALARQGLGQFREGAEDLTRGLECGGTETRVYFLRARLREKAGDRAGSRADFAEGLRRQPTDEKSWIARGFARLGDDPEGALADFEQALRANPRSGAALQNKAHVLAERLGRTEEALAALDRAVALYPDAALYRSSRGVLAARLGRRAQAHADAEDALLRDAGPPRLYQAGCIYALTSRQEPEDRTRALHLLSSALRKGYGLDLVDTDHDLDPLRDLPEFRRLIAAVRALGPTGPAAKAP